jgi:UDP-glucose 4-epimerase
MSENPKKLLIIGIAGGLAQITARLILSQHPEWKILGIDSRPIELFSDIDGLEILTMKYSRGNFENLFRAHHFSAVFHLGRISHSSNDADMLARRLELSVMGTSRILDLCLRSAVKKVIILSTLHVYGALADNSVFLNEEAPLRASIKYPELRDVVEMDQLCGQFMWRHQNEISTVMLRPCNIIGTQIQNAMTKFLSSPISLKPIDYNPFFQFIHEFDMAQVLCQSIQNLPTGTYNVASNEFIALREALDVVGAKSIPFPMMMAQSMNEILKTFKLDVPDYLIDYLKYSCLISNKELLQHLGKDFFRFSIKESLELIRLR